MENMKNIAEILKDCPQGMELDCTLFDNVKFIRVEEDDKPICIRTGVIYLYLTKFGTWTFDDNAKCVIFPKGKTTWEGFQRPFKDGDILATDLGSVFFLNMRLNTDEYYGCYVGIGGDSSFHICVPFAYKECCGLATEEEKEKLFQAIKDNGYKWNAETKTLEKLIEPKFKVGDRIKSTISSSLYTVVDIKYETYYIKNDGEKYPYSISFTQENLYELVPNKFDISTLTPFDNCKYSLDGGITWKYAQYWFIQEKYNTKDIDIELWQG